MNKLDNFEFGVKRGWGKRRKGRQKTKSLFTESVLIYNLTFFIMISNFILYLRKDRINIQGEFKPDRIQHNKHIHQNHYTKMHTSTPWSGSCCYST